MNIKNALLICGRNFVLIWKQMVYTLILVALVGLCLWGTLTPIFDMLSSAGWFEELLSYLELVYKEPANVAAGFEGIMTKLWVLFVNNAPVLWGNYIVSILLIALVPSFALSLSYYTAGDLVNAKLCSSVNYGWIHRFLSSLKSSVPFALINTLIKIPFMALGVGALMLYGALANTFLKATLFLPLLIIVLLAIFSLKFTLSMWFLPDYLTNGKGLFKSLKNNFKLVGRHFSRLALGAFLLYLVEFASIMLLTVFTLGAGLILIIPALPVVNVAYSLISYYQENSMRYYIDANTIVSPVQD